MWQFNMDRFSVLIELWLDMHNLTPQELGDLSGLSAQKIHQFKRGDNAPTMAEFTAICSTVNMPPETFFKDVKNAR